MNEVACLSDQCVYTDRQSAATRCVLSLGHRGKHDFDDTKIWPVGKRGAAIAGELILDDEQWAVVRNALRALRKRREKYAKNPCGGRCPRHGEYVLIGRHGPCPICEEIKRRRT